MSVASVKNLKTPKLTKPMTITGNVRGISIAARIVIIPEIKYALPIVFKWLSVTNMIGAHMAVSTAGAVNFKSLFISG